MHAPDASELRELLRQTHGLDPDDETIDLRQTLRPPESGSRGGEPRTGTETVRLEDAPAEATPDEGTAISEPPPPETGFAIEDELGRGGMNVVYRALQKDLQRDVALKKIRADKDHHRSARWTFLEEARLTGSLEHPNIVPVHALDISPKGEIALTMKLVEGHTWAALLHPKTDEERTAAAGTDIADHLRILVAVCNAISFAHSRGVVHRDIKPENVMLGAFGEVVLMDWGIAIRTAEGGTTPRGGRIKLAGTPAYMAPEMVDPGGLGIGERTDVYLLGGVLYEILSGHPPHAAKNLIEALAHATAHANPEIPASAPPELARLCREAMARAPEDRPSSAMAFRLRLEEHLAHRESLALSARATEMLAACRHEFHEHHDAHPEQRSGLYGDLARVIAGFEQARLLWAENPEAEAGENEARYELAEIALAAGDLVMARSAAAVATGERAEHLSRQVDAAVAARAATRHAAKRIATALVALQVIVAGLLGYFAFLELDEFYREETVQRLNDVTPIVAMALREADSLSPGAIQPILDSISTDERMRITVIAPGGQVLGDSDAAPAGMQNHADREEVRSALRTGSGIAVRRSPTLGTRMVYRAMSMLDAQGEPLAIVRTSLPWSSAHGSLMDFIWPLATALALAVGIGAFATLIAWRRLDRQVAKL